MPWLANPKANPRAAIFFTITYLLAMMVGLDEVTTKSLLPRNVTASIAMGISEIIGGIPSLTAIVTVVTGIIGAAVGSFVLDMKLGSDVEKMRAIGEEAFALVSKYGGSHSGEHGDGIVRSEFNEVMFGAKMAALFKEVKQLFDPEHIFNPGKIVDAPKMDARQLFRYAPGYQIDEFPTQLDWSGWPGSAGGLQGAVEMCNNNGACRKLEGGVMCPSFRATDRLA